MKLSERLQIKLEKSGSRLKLDELSNTELIDLMVDDFRPYKSKTVNQGAVYPDEDFDDVLKGA
jgi:hypothetical protein